jgi:hypothetical protein
LTVWSGFRKEIGGVRERTFVWAISAGRIREERTMHPVNWKVLQALELWV